jgi:hypothetical protein
MKKILPLIILINIFLFENLFASKNLYLSYKEQPKVVYENQRFEVVIKALITTNDFDSIVTNFWDERNIEVLNPDSQWEEASPQEYENRFFFKAKKGFKLPIFSIKLIKDEQIIDLSELKPTKIEYSDIVKGDVRFSGIIASDLILKAYKTKQYNNKESLTIIDIDAVNSNLEDFSLRDVLDQGISDLKDDYPNQNLIYFFVKPVHKKKVIFNYYNTNTKSLVEVTIPLILQNELVSTQTDLNPNDSSFEKYKKIAIIVLLITFILLFVWKRKKIYIFFSMLFIILALIYLTPNKVGLVKQGSYIYILPTKNSTIFFKLEKNERVEILSKKNDFIKIMGKDNKFIGWIKEENLGKN